MLFIVNTVNYIGPILFAKKNLPPAQLLLRK